MEEVTAHERQWDDFSEAWEFVFQISGVNGTSSWQHEGNVSEHLLEAYKLAHPAVWRALGCEGCMKNFFVDALVVDDYDDEDEEKPFANCAHCNVTVCDECFGVVGWKQCRYPGCLGLYCAQHAVRVTTPNSEILSPRWFCCVPGEVQISMFPDDWRSVGWAVPLSDVQMAQWEAHGWHDYGHPLGVPLPGVDDAPAA